MNPFSIVYGYVLWHYTKAYYDILTLWVDMFQAVARFFSVVPLILTLFSPWKRMQEGAREGDVEDFFATLVVNIISRVVGFLLRLVLIFVGSIALLVMVFFLLFGTLLWTILPIVAVLSSMFGFTLL